MNVVQNRPNCNPPSTNAIALKLWTLTHITSNYLTDNEENPCLPFRVQGSQLQRTRLVFFIASTYLYFFEAFQTFNALASVQY